MIARDELDLDLYPTFPDNEQVRTGGLLTHSLGIYYDEVSP